MLKAQDNAPFEHICANGSQVFTRRNFEGGLKVTRPRGLSDARFAADLIEFAAFHTQHIRPELSAFIGHGDLQIEIIKEPILGNVDEIGLPSRIVKALNDAEINTISELVIYSKSQLRQITGIGPAGLAKIISAVEYYGGLGQ